MSNPPGSDMSPQDAEQLQESAMTRLGISNFSMLRDATLNMWRHWHKLEPFASRADLQKRLSALRLKTKKCLENEEVLLKTQKESHALYEKYLARQKSGCRKPTTEEIMCSLQDLEQDGKDLTSKLLLVKCKVLKEYEALQKIIEKTVREEQIED